MSIANLKEIESKLIEKYNPKKIDDINEESPSWIGFNEKGKSFVVTGILSDCYCDQKKGNLLYANESFYEYRESLGIWEERKEDVIKKEIRQIISEYNKALAKKIIVEDVIYQVKLIALVSSGFEFDRLKTKLNLENGVLDIDTMMLEPFQREYYQTIKLSFSYHPDASCYTWKYYLDSLKLLPETIERLQEWAGYCFTPDVKIQKCLYLKGEGDNGKSRYLETIAGMLGKSCSRLEITEIFQDFKTPILQGKLANICADIKTGLLNDKFKEIIDGCEVIANVKFKNPFQFKPFAKFLFSANNFLPTKDRSHGFFKRFDVIEFKRKFTKEEINPNLQDEIDQERAGIFIWALEGLKRLRKNNWKLTESREFDETKEEFQKESNPVQSFIEEYCSIIPLTLAEGVDKFMQENNLETPEDYYNHILKMSASVKAAYTRYQEFCKDYGYSPLTEVHFGKEIQRLGIERTRVTRTGEKKRVYIYKRLIV